MHVSTMRATFWVKQLRILGLGISFTPLLSDMKCRLRNYTNIELESLACIVEARLLITKE